jgi:predicted transposase YbfD/YdcC
VLLAETFVDMSRFHGTCYRASNWIHVGQTTGWARRGRTYWHHGREKAVFLYSLHRCARARLQGKDCSVEMFKPREATMLLDVERLTLEGEDGLFEILKTIKDPRKRRGVRHPAVSLLALAATATLAGVKGVTAIAQWVEDLPWEIRKRLGSTRTKAPDESTFRRLFTRIDPQEFDGKTGAWVMRHRSALGQGVALDGKTLRGSRDGDTPPVHLVSAVLHQDGTVLSQTRVAEKSNEITSVGPVLKDVDAKGSVITGDAMFAQTAIAKYIVEEKEADYLFTVKDNQPTLRANIENMRLESFPPGAHGDQPRAREDRDAPDLGD